MSRPLAARAALVAIALACVAWFALGAYQQHQLARAQAIITAGHLSPAGALRASALLSGAATLNPGVTVTELRAQLAAARGAHVAARRLAARAAHAEPLNPDAWLLYTQLSAHTAQQRPAFAHLVSLVPPVTAH